MKKGSARALWLAMAAGAALAALSLPAPSILWEWRNHAAGLSVSQNGLPNAVAPQMGLLLIHPPSMAYLVGASIALFGDRQWALRLPGFLLFFASGALLWAAAAELVGGAAAGVAAAIFLTNPLGIQGALGIDFADGSLLTASAALFFWLLAKKGRGVLLGAALGLVVWSKFATAFLLICAYTAAAWLDADRARARREWLRAMLVGGASFSASWLALCCWLSSRPGVGQGALDLALEPFRYITGSGAATPAGAAGLSSWALYQFSFAAYAGPLLLVLAALGARRWVTGAPRRTVLLFALFCLALYGFMLGGGRAYPKYFHTLLLPLALIAADWLGDDEVRWEPLLAAAAWYALAVGDHLYTLNFSLREAALSGGTRAALGRLGTQWILYALPVALVLRGPARARRAGLCAVLLGSQLGLSAAQLAGRYDLRQAYGAPQADFLETARVVREWPAKGPLLADRAVVDAAGADRVSGYGSSSWEDLGAISVFIREQNPKAVVYGLPINTIAQLKAIPENGELVSLLTSRYEVRDIGPFEVWLKRR